MPGLVTANASAPLSPVSPGLGGAARDGLGGGVKKILGTGGGLGTILTRAVVVYEEILRLRVRAVTHAVVVIESTALYAFQWVLTTPAGPLRYGLALRWSNPVQVWRGLRDETPLVLSRSEKGATHARPEG